MSTRICPNSAQIMTLQTKIEGGGGEGIPTPISYAYALIGIQLEII